MLSIACIECFGHRGRRLAASIAAVAITVAPPVSANDGYYDSTWAGGGYFSFSGYAAHTEIGSHLTSAHIELNGNLISTGYLDVGGWWLTESAPNGSFVPTFGAQDGSGRTTSCQILPTCGGDGLVDVAPLGDGRYIVLGGGNLTRTTAQAHGYEATVSIDSLAVNDAGGYISGPAWIAVQPDGKILVAGTAHYSALDSTLRFGIARFTSNLQLDTSFGAHTDSKGTTFAGGTIVTIDPVADTDQITAMLVQGNKILLVGYTFYSDVGYYEGIDVVRLNGADGSIDTSFGTSGIAKAGSASTRESAGASLDAAGRIYVSLNTIDGVGYVKFSSDGTPLLSAATPTFETVGCSGGALASDLSVDSAGRVLVAANCYADNHFYFAAFRFRGDNGALDTTFGIAGESYGYFNALSTNDSVQRLIFDASGHPVLFGATKPSSTQAGAARLQYDLIFTNGNESTPRGCLPPACG